MKSSEQVVFESYWSQLAVDNYANAHICSDEDILTDKIGSIISNGVGIIGGKDFIQKLIGTVSWSCNYDEGKLHKNRLNNVPYFPYSPVNILSETELAEPMKNDEGTWVLIKLNIIFLLGILGGTKRQ